MTYSISPATLTIEQVGEILHKKIKLALSPEARELIVKCREFLDNKIEHSAEPIYGITTGFGSLCNISIGKEDLSRCSLKSSRFRLATPACSSQPSSAWSRCSMPT